MCHNQAILYETDFFLNGNLSELERLTAEVSRFCSTHSLGQEVEFDLNLVLEELFVNTVRHGGCDGMESSSRVRLRYDSAVEVEFYDRGRPFDPTLVPPADIDAPLDQREGGMGIHLVRRIMSDVKYRRLDDWNHLSMRRRERKVVADS